MKFEWDPLKRQECLEERGLDFADCKTLFAGAVYQYQDMRENYGEVRMRAYGELHSKLVACVYTDRGDTRRIISMWRIHGKEAKIFKEWLDRKRNRERR